MDFLFFCAEAGRPELFLVEVGIYKVMIRWSLGQEINFLNDRMEKKGGALLFFIEKGRERDGGIDWLSLPCLHPTLLHNCCPQITLIFAFRQSLSS